MKCLNTVVGLSLLIGVFVTSGRSRLQAADEKTRRVDVAVCLDTSNSMDGLIESAKQKLWAVVNELTQAKPTPHLRVALYHYGNTGLNSEVGWVEKKLDLTDDLDEVYNQLFSLTTNGGTEYVARVMSAARDGLKWARDRDELKMIFVCGNEPATQDPKITIQDACKKTIGKGIIVNSIFCGNSAEGEQTGWRDVAVLADGRYAAIDQDHGVVQIPAPQDKELAKLSEALNKTYLPFGAHGAYGASNQRRQDSNAATLNAASVAERTVAKASAQYRNARWDLVDASKTTDFDLAKIPVKQLPESMRKMTPAERKAHLEKLAADREGLQKKIAELGRKRQAFIAAEMKKRNLDDKQSLDAAIRKAVREQAAARGFKFGTP